MSTKRIKWLARSPGIEESEFKNIVLIRKNKIKAKHPESCSICNLLLNSLDFESYESNQACSECIKAFLEPNYEQWRAGWRPNRAEVKKMLKKRENIPFFFRRE
mgnify:CR=1 FL=1